MRDRRDGRDIVDFKTGIGRRFEKQKFCFGPHRRAPLGQIRAIDESRGNAKARQQILDHIETGAEHGAGGDH